MLHCEFPLGRPLGKPGDAEFQTDVITTAFALLGRTDVPILEDYPVVIEEGGSQPSSCPFPPRLDPSAPVAVDEARGLREAYDRNVDAVGRTLVGRVAGADGIAHLVEQLLDIEAGASLEEIGWDAPTTIAVGQDIRAYYEEAGLQLADNTGARQLLSWFYEVTEAGKLLVRVRDVLTARGDNKMAAMYIVPGTQRSAT